MKLFPRFNAAPREQPLTLPEERLLLHEERGYGPVLPSCWHRGPSAASHTNATHDATRKGTQESKMWTREVAPLVWALPRPEHRWHRSPGRSEGWAHTRNPMERETEGLGLELNKYGKFYQKLSYK